MTLHLIGTHHGDGRPFAAPYEDDTLARVGDLLPSDVTLFGERFLWPAVPGDPATANATAPDRFWRVVRNHGWWGRAVRKAAGRNPTPSAGGLDSQTVKATEVGGDRGFDQARKVTGAGKKRHTGVDTLGLLLAVAVTGGGVSDPAGAKLLCRQLTPDRFPRLALFWADGKYHNYDLYEHMEGRVRWSTQVVSRPPDEGGG